MNELQSEILNIFKSIKTICDKNNIRYYAFGGTCIGAVRHGGLIPWDDDLDIVMPDKDYLRFIEIAPQLLPDGLELLTPDSNPAYNNLFIKVHNINTTFVESQEARYPQCYKGVFVDIMPLGGIPANLVARRKHIQRLELLMRLNHKRRSYFSFSNRMNHRISWILLSPLKVISPYRIWSKKWLKQFSKYLFDSSPFTGHLWRGIITENLIFPSIWFEDFVELPFEDTMIRCPKEYDAYLTHEFGKYMEYPPEEKRVSPHAYIVDLLKPYTWYQKKNASTKKQ